MFSRIFFLFSRTPCSDVSFFPNLLKIQYFHIFTPVNFGFSHFSFVENHSDCCSNLGNQTHLTKIKLK